MEGQGIVSERVAQRWFQRFNTGEENTKDLSLSGRPKLWDIENIRRIFKEILQKRVRKLSEKLGASQDTINRHIKTFGKS